MAEATLLAYDLAPDGSYADVTLEIPDASPAASLLMCEWTDSLSLRDTPTISPSGT